MVEINRPPRVMFKVSFEMFSQSLCVSSPRKNQIRLEMKLLEKANFDIGQVQLGRITESQKTD